MMYKENKYSILIVDDEPNNIIALTEILETYYTVFAVVDSVEAVETAEETEPDLILLDVLMPVMDGYEVIAGLRSSEKTRDIPVIFITGLDSTEAEEKGLILGAADYITKPFHAAIVMMRVGNQIKILERLRQQTLMTEISHKFLSDAHMDTQFSDTLQMVGEFMNLSQALIYEADDDEISLCCRYEWFNPELNIVPENVDSRRNYKLTIDESIKVLIGNILGSGNHCINSNERSFREATKYYRANPEETFITIPIFVENRLCAILDFSRDDDGKRWSSSELDLAVLTSGILTSAYERNAFERSLIAARYDLVETRKMEEEMTALSHWYKTILDSIPSPVTVTDSDMNWTFVNTAVEKFLGEKREDLYGKPCSNWGADICNTENCGIECVKRGIKHTFFRDNDSYYQVDVEELHDLSGKSVGFIEVVSDITEVEAQREIAVSAKELAEKSSRAKSDFLANMSHEMRTPLNAIIGMTLLGKRAQDKSEAYDALAKIDDASMHLLGIVNDMLDMAKIEANELELAPIEFVLGNTIDKVIEVIKFSTDEKFQTLSYNLDAEIPGVIIADSQRLAQALNNLLANAVKFTPKNGEVRLDVSLVEKDPIFCTLCFKVKDTGIGIEPELQDKLFEKFEQADVSATREYGGTGLGLSIVKRIVELMDGKIWVESEPGKGSTFIFTVKVQCGDEDSVNVFDDSDSDITQLEVLENKDAFKGKKLLVVEDIEINREIVTAILDGTGLEIDCAENGKEALDMIAADPEKYDVVFMDLQMPVMDGLEATRKIRELPPREREELPIIAMTANVFQDDVDACFDAGMNEHVGKPLDYNTVIRVLRQYVLGESPDERRVKPGDRRRETGRHKSGRRYEDR